MPKTKCIQCRQCKKSFERTSRAGKYCPACKMCPHGRPRSQCKECGTHRGLLKGGFTEEQIKEISAIQTCQYPNCLIQGVLNSDHFHDGEKINTENYRGEICRGHNLLLADLDKHPELVNSEAKRYVNRRPYSRIHLNSLTKV